MEKKEKLIFRQFSPYLPPSHDIRLYSIVTLKNWKKRNYFLKQTNIRNIICVNISFGRKKLIKMQKCINKKYLNSIEMKTEEEEIKEKMKEND